MKKKGIKENIKQIKEKSVNLKKEKHRVPVHNASKNKTKLITIQQ